MILYIDTTELNRAAFALSGSPLKQMKKQVFKIKPHENFKTVAKLAGFLKKNKIFLSTSPALSSNSGHPPHGLGRGIRRIYVNKGPGSFVGTRTGVSIALALKMALKVPIKFLNKEKFSNQFL